MALDPGARRTGVAVSDELGLYAHLRPAIRGGARALLEAMPALVEREGVDEVVVGLPLTLAGGDSDQTRAVRALAGRLRERLDVPVRLRDERLTTVEAARRVPAAASRRDGTLDSAAAAVLLQAELDARARGSGAP